MKKTWTLTASAAAIVILAGCNRGPAVMPTKNVPAGEVHLEFTQKVKGPLDLTLDGVRIPVEQKVEKGKTLIIKGLTPGKHRYFLTSPQDAFGPDAGEFEVAADKGLYRILFSQTFKATLYGTPQDLPKAEGLPGVKARLEK